MIRTVDDIDMSVDHLVTAHNAIEHRLLDALLTRWNVFLWNVPTDDFVIDCNPFTTLVRMRLNDYVSILPAAAGLLDQLAFAVSRTCNRFAICDLGLASVGIDFELAKHSVANDFQVQLAHPSDDCLTGVFVGENLKCRIFF